MKIQKLTVMSILIAVSIVLVALVHFPLIPAVAFMEYDPADIPILMATLMFGPGAGLGVTVVACIIQGITVSAGSGVYGILMHIVATGSFVLTVGLLSKILGTAAKGRGITLAVGCLCMAAVMVPANLLITPLFMGVPVEAVKGMLLPAIIPFNLLKAGMNGLLTFVLYHPVASFVKGRLPECNQPLSSAPSEKTSKHNHCA